MAGLAPSRPSADAPTQLDFVVDHLSPLLTDRYVAIPVSSPIPAAHVHMAGDPRMEIVWSLGLPMPQPAQNHHGLQIRYLWTWGYENFDGIGYPCFRDTHLEILLDWAHTLSQARGNRRLLAASGSPQLQHIDALQHINALRLHERQQRRQAEPDQIAALQQLVEERAAAMERSRQAMELQRAQSRDQAIRLGQPTQARRPAGMMPPDLARALLGLDVD